MFREQSVYKTWGCRDLNPDLRLASGESIVIAVMLNLPLLEAPILPSYTTAPQLFRTTGVLLKFLGIIKVFKNIIIARAVKQGQPKGAKVQRPGEPKAMKSFFL